MFVLCSGALGLGWGRQGGGEDGARARPSSLEAELAWALCGLLDRNTSLSTVPLLALGDTLDQVEPAGTLSPQMYLDPEASCVPLGVEEAAAESNGVTPCLTSLRLSLSSLKWAQSRLACRDV